MANPQKIKAVISEIIDYGNQVYKLMIQAEKKIPRFRAGQFLHLTLDNFDPTTGFWPESRVFSIASCSDDRTEVAVVYSVKGKYTRRMQQELSPGAAVWLKAPYGDFIIPNHLGPGETAVLIAGGTGVSPFIPFLKDIPDGIRVVLNYGIRGAGLMIFERELEEASKNTGFSLNLFIEEAADAISLEGVTDIKAGRLSVSEILSNGFDKNSAKFFISGPPEMIELFKRQLKEESIDEQNIITDEWG